MKQKLKNFFAVFMVLVLVLSLCNVTGIEAKAATKKPTKITLKTTYKTVDINGKVTVSVKTVKPEGASKSVSYKSSDKKIATIDSKGVVTGKKAGTVTITATSKNNSKVKATIKITVKDIKPTKVTLNNTSVSGFMGATKKIKATVKPANSSQKVTYKSSNTKVATVNSSGKITYKSPGETKITVTTGQKNKDGKKVTAVCKVKVKDRVDANIDWQYMTADELFTKLDRGEKVTVLDIRPEKIEDTVYGYKDGHIEGALWIPAWPVDTIVRQNKLRTLQVTEALNGDDAPIVIVCRSGAAGAKRAISVLKGFEGIKASRMYILEGGGTGLIESYSDRLVTGVEEFKGEYVISASQLKAKIDAKEKIIIVDTRGISDSKTTVKGAITMTWKMISKSEKSDGTKQGEAGYARTLEAKEISTVLSKLGLGTDDQIILISDGYTTGGWGDDGRVLWQLLQCGYTNVKMVNGGVSAMKALCGKSWESYSQTGPSDAVKKTVTVKNVDQEVNSITTEKLLSMYKNGEVFKAVDVRKNAEYNGEILYKETSGGHLKGALHIRFTDLFRADGTLKSVDELTKMFEKAGISKEDKIITYCTGGIRSGYMYLVLKMCGFDNILNYAESTYRWSNTESAGTGAYWVK